MESFDGDHILEIEGVTKRYGDLTAVDDVSLAIEPGEIVALLGPNGAGKTTLISCVTGLLTDFEGEVRVAGFDVTDRPQITRRLVGLVPQELKYDAFFTVRDVLQYQAGFFGVRPEDRRVDELLEAFSLADKADQRTRHLSGGMQRRLMICKALMHDPVLLFLDEPTAGVDVELREELWDYVRGLRQRGTTIVLTTHYIEEAERLADRVGILHEGELLRVDDREDLLREFGVRRLSVEFVDEVADGALPSLDGLEVEREGPRRATLQYRVPTGELEGGTPVDRFLQAIGDTGASVRSLEGGRTSLEEVFKQLIYEANG
ncbi:MAG: ABC transporter ATP-binding protein [Bradymonadaceae bacterium]